ncbi:MAG: histidine kinase dimerization/phospho-acceptor domain-containing protein [Cyanobacteriota bacterium]|nr:histidine kinase dimerization/phospho-acceptor domain-containing protein [Cyanobacteriota bacterium]
MNEIEVLRNEIAALKEELQQTQVAYDMAVQMSQFKAGFLARTSHELRSPLNSLIGLHQLILSDLCDSPEEEREFIHQAHQSSLKLVQLIDTIVDVAKTEYGTNRLEIVPLQLSRTLNELDYLTQLQAANRGFPIRFTPPEPDLYVMADERRLLQLLLALVDTSLAYMEEGNIEVSAQLSTQSDGAAICIDLHSPLKIWGEPVDLLQQGAKITPQTAKEQLIASPKAPSPGMNLILAQTLLDSMQGKLEIIEIPSDGDDGKITRLQCVVPLGDAEVVDRALRDD